MGLLHDMNMLTTLKRETFQCLNDGMSEAETVESCLEIKGATEKMIKHCIELAYASLDEVYGQHVQRF